MSEITSLGQQLMQDIAASGRVPKLIKEKQYAQVKQEIERCIQIDQAIMHDVQSLMNSEVTRILKQAEDLVPL